MDNSRDVQSCVCGLCQTTMRDVSLVQVCDCRSGWVHTDCMLVWVARQEIVYPGLPAICSNCRRPYTVVPAPDLVLAAMQVVACGYTLLIKSSVYDTVCFAVLAEVTFSAIGMLTLTFVCGVGAVEQLILSIGPVKTLVVCQTIPYTSILINCIPWEDAILNGLRRCSRLPGLGLVLPREDPSVVPRRVYPRLNASTLYEGFLFPLYAVFTGNLIFKYIQSDLHRFALGGVVFFTLKSIVNMYRKQKMYTRRRFLRVANFEGTEGSNL